MVRSFALQAAGKHSVVTKLSVNGTVYEIDVDENMPLLWVLRDELGLTGTKYGCGKGLCGACSVLIDGQVMRSCAISASAITGEVTTIEGAGNPEAPHPVQASWIEHQVAQCGYCQPGMIIATIGLLNRNPDPSDEDIEAALSGNLCRCGTYSRVRAAVKSAATSLNSSASPRGIDG